MYEAQFTHNSLSDLSFYWPMWQICMTKLHEPSVKSLTKFQMWICIGITRFQPQNLMKVNLTAPLDIQNLNFLLNDSLKKAMQTLPGSHSTAKFWFYRSISMVVGKIWDSIVPWKCFYVVSGWNCPFSSSFESGIYCPIRIQLQSGQQC